MKNKKEKLHRYGWKSRFVRLTSMLMLCFNVLSAPFTAIGIATVGVATVTLAVSCEKDDSVSLEQNQQQQQTKPQKHNVELVYYQNEETEWQNISLDTLYKYNADPNVDTIFMVPQMTNQFSTYSTNQLKYITPLLRERHNVNPNKVFGKGELQLWNQSVLGHPEIYRFFADTLKYTVTYRETASKSR